MARPRRLYTDENGKFYYIINKKKVLIKVPKGATMKQVQKVNIKNIVNLTQAKRIKRRKKKVNAKFEKVPQQNLLSSLVKQTEGGLPYYIFKEKQQFPTLDDISKGTDKDKFKQDFLDYIRLPQRLALPPPENPNLIMGELLPSAPPVAPELIESADIPRVKRPLPPIPISISNLDEAGSPIVSPLKSKIQPKAVPVIYRASSKFISDLFTTAGKVLSKQDISKKTTKLINQETYEKAIKKYNKGLKGGGDDDDGLYNDEIEKILTKRIKDYVPVIPADKTNDLLKYVARGDKRFSAVINTADSKSDGTGKNGNSMGHWTSVYINNEDDFPTIEYFDPLVQNDIPDRLYNTLRKIARTMNPEMMFKFKPNMIRRQNIKTSTCGYHSMKFLDDRYNGMPFHEASGYDNFIEQNKGADDSLDGEKDIDDYKKKYSNYI